MQAQRIAAVTRRLNGGVNGYAVALLHIRIFDERDPTESGHRDVDDAGVVIQLKQIGSISPVAGRRFIGIKLFNSADRALQDDLAQVIYGRIRQNSLNLGRLGGATLRWKEAENDNTGQRSDHHVGEVNHRPDCSIVY